MISEIDMHKFFKYGGIILSILLFICFIISNFIKETKEWRITLIIATMMSFGMYMANKGIIEKLESKEGAK